MRCECEVRVLGASVSMRVSVSLCESELVNVRCECAEC